MNGREKLCVCIACAGIVGVSAAWVTQPDGTPEPKKYTDVEWFTVVNVSYHAGESEAALKTIFDVFKPAAQAAGLPGAQVFEYSTGGEWDITLIFPMPGGPGDLEWEISPEDIRWMGAMAERAGGIEEARAILTEYRTHIARHESSVVRRRK